MRKKSFLIGGTFMAGAASVLCLAFATQPTDLVASPTPSPTATSSNWRDSLVPCDTPDATTMVEGCYWDKGDQPYMITDDGEMFYVDDATGARTYVEPEDEPWYVAPNIDADGKEVFSDGSWLAADGSSGCLPTGSCASLPPVPDTAVPSGNGGYLPTMELPPCHIEDADYNCYWDATRQGNGRGKSFIVWDGAYYYAQ